MDALPRTPMPTLMSPFPSARAPSPSPCTKAPSASPSESSAPPAPPPPRKPYPYPQLDEQRRQLAAERAGGKKRKLDKMRPQHIVEMRDRFTDAIEGRDPEALEMFDEGYNELWELLQERDQLADLECLHLKKIERLSGRCFDLEESRDKWRARCNALQARLKEHGLPSDY